MPSLSFFPSKCFFVNCTVFTYDDVRTYGSMPRIQLSLKICRFPYDGLSAILYFFPPPPPPHDYQWKGLSRVTWASQRQLRCEWKCLSEKVLPSFFCFFKTSETRGCLNCCGPVYLGVRSIDNRLENRH